MDKGFELTIRSPGECTGCSGGGFKGQLTKLILLGGFVLLCNLAEKTIQAIGVRVERLKRAETPVKSPEKASIEPFFILSTILGTKILKPRFLSQSSPASSQTISPTSDLFIASIQEMVSQTPVSPHAGFRPISGSVTPLLVDRSVESPRSEGAESASTPIAYGPVVLSSVDEEEIAPRSPTPPPVVSTLRPASPVRPLSPVDEEEIVDDSVLQEVDPLAREEVASLLKLYRVPDEAYDQWRIEPTPGENQYYKFAEIRLADASGTFKLFGLVAPKAPLEDTIPGSFVSLSDLDKAFGPVETVAFFGPVVAVAARSDYVAEVRTSEPHEDQKEREAQARATHKAWLSQVGGNRGKEPSESVPYRDVRQTTRVSSKTQAFPTRPSICVDGTATEILNTLIILKDGSARLMAIPYSSQEEMDRLIQLSREVEMEEASPAVQTKSDSYRLKCNRIVQLLKSEKELNIDERRYLAQAQNKRFESEDQVDEALAYLEEHRFGPLATIGIIEEEV